MEICIQNILLTKLIQAHSHICIFLPISLITLTFQTTPIYFKVYITLHESDHDKPSQLLQLGKGQRRNMKWVMGCTYSLNPTIYGKRTISNIHLALGGMSIFAIDGTSFHFRICWHVFILTIDGSSLRLLWGFVQWWKRIYHLLYL